MYSLGAEYFELYSWELFVANESGWLLELVLAT